MLPGGQPPVVLEMWKRMRMRCMLLRQGAWAVETGAELLEEMGAEVLVGGRGARINSTERKRLKTAVQHGAMPAATIKEGGRTDRRPT